jgi:hypothetical protein
MTNILKLSSLVLLLLLLTACKPPHHPKNPNYAIKKPSVKYKPNKKNLDKMVKDLQGSPYVWAEEGPNNFDCSGFTYYMYGSMGIEIPRVAREQAKKGQRIKVDELVYGDLIFFATEKRIRGKITHVGMYLGNGWFTHASTKNHEIIYSNLNTSTYYKKRLRICRRYLPKTELLVKNELAPWKKKEAIQLKAPVIAKTIPKRPIPTKAMPLAQKDIGHYYIQVGSFSGKPNDALLYKITRLGYQYKLIQFPVGNKEITKLLIGPYKQKNLASHALPHVKQQIQKNAFIAEIR